jgi:hypothetical protein
MRLILQLKLLYLRFGGSLPWFESKFTLSDLEYSLYTYSEQVLRNVGSKANQDVSVLLIGNELWAVNGSSLKLKVFLSLWEL